MKDAKELAREISEYVAGMIDWMGEVTDTNRVESLILRDRREVIEEIRRAVSAVRGFWQEEESGEPGTIGMMRVVPIGDVLKVIESLKAEIGSGE